MKFIRRGRLIAILIVCLAVAGYFFYIKGAPKAKEAVPATEAASPIANVEIAPIKEVSISDTIAAYGDVVPAPGALQIVSVPYEIRVNRVMVSKGQKISRTDALMEIEPSPDAFLKLEQARNIYEISKQNLDHAKELFGLKLATNTQLLQAREAFQQASLRLESLRSRGVDGKKTIQAPVDGLISAVQVQEGAIVPAGNPLMGIVAQDQLEVRLGIEPKDIWRLAADQPVSLSYVNEPAKQRISGRIRKISRAVDPATRLADVFVSLPRPCGFLLGEYIMGRIETASSYGMVVPRSAVLPENGKNVLYTVQNGHAVKHFVQVGIESGDEVQFTGNGLKPGDDAVVLGNYELRDRMAVKATRAR